jgi:hypothetical protein
VGIVDGRKDYVSWADVWEQLRWLERGYNVKLLFHLRAACPPGEQFLRGYWELTAQDMDDEPVPLPNRILGKFPNTVSKTVPGMLLGMLLATDSILSQVRLWTEPTIGAKPRMAEQD